jgi:hypothetical protein
MPNLDLAGMENKAVGLWNRPGGKIKGVLFLGLLGFFFYRVAPIVTNMLDNGEQMLWGFTKFAWALAICGISLAFLYMLFFTDKPRKIGLALWDLLIDHTIGLIVPYKPEVLARAEVEENFKEVSKLEKTVDDVASTEESIKTKRKEIEDNIADAQSENNQYAKLQPSVRTPLEMIQGKIAVNQNKIGNWQRFLAKLVNMEAVMTTVRTNLNKMAAWARTEAEVHRDNVEFQIEEYQFTKKTSGAMQRFANIIAGKNDKAMMGEAALMYMSQKSAENTATVKQIVRRSKDLLNSIDLQQAMYDQKALDFINEANQRVVTDVTKTPQVSYVPAGTTQKSSYDNL